MSPVSALRTTSVNLVGAVADERVIKPRAFVESCSRAEDDEDGIRCVVGIREDILDRQVSREEVNGESVMAVGERTVWNMNQSRSGRFRVRQVPMISGLAQTPNFR